MAEAAKRYLYRGRVLGVWQFLSSLECGIRSQDGAGIGSSSYRSVKNSELGRCKGE
ncbi:hypothetical protein [Cloacibacillus evryensis]|uniref:hypothetical protein n=1 Tax=Cloacibacillus evryensis TaxID=508460 RepID=UPI00370D2411